jgi:hypothetical protein
VLLRERSVIDDALLGYHGKTQARKLQNDRLVVEVACKNCDKG